MTSEHLRPILENVGDIKLVYQVAQLLLTTANIPQEVLDVLRVGRLTALQKPNGGVRGIVAGDVFRRFVARTMAQQLWPAIERATSLFHYALFAFLGDVCVVCSLDRVSAICGILQNVLLHHSSIRVHHGKIQVWNREGLAPRGIDVMQAVARIHDPDAIVWRGDVSLPTVDQGVQLLGTPLGHPDFVRAQLASLSTVHDRLLQQVPTIPDLRCELSATFAAHHDASLRRCLSRLLGVDQSSVYWDLASLPLSLGCAAQH